MPPDLQRRIIDHYAESNMEVARAFFGRDDLFGEVEPQVSNEPPREGIGFDEIARMLMA